MTLMPQIIADTLEKISENPLHPRHPRSIPNLELYYVRWLVVIVVIYTAVSLLRSAITDGVIVADKRSVAE